MIDGVPAFAKSAATPKSGYFFGLTAAQNGGAGLYLTYSVGGEPAVFHQTGVRGFCWVEDAVVMFEPNGPGGSTATCAQPQLAPLNN